MQTTRMEPFLSDIGGNAHLRTLEDIGLLVSRARRANPPSSADDSWWIDENMTRLYTHDNATLDELFRFGARVEYIFLYLYAFVAVVGIIANGLVVLRMCTNQRLRTPSNYFIVNLAVSDLIVLVVLLVVRILVGYLSQVYRVPVVWNALLFIQHVCIQATALVLAAMSFTRYHFIVHPLEARSEWTSRRVWIMCGIIWIVSCLIYIPIWFGVLYVEGNTVTELVPIPTKRKVFSICRLIPMFLIPAIIILVSYCRIVATFRSRGNFLQGTSPDANESFKRQTDLQARKLTRTVVIIIFVFFLSWGPYQFYLSGLDLRPYFLQRSPQRWKAVVLSSASLRLLAYCGCAINPFVYAYSNPAFLKMKRLRSLFCGASATTKSTSLETPRTSTVQLTERVKNSVSLDTISLDTIQKPEA